MTVARPLALSEDEYLRRERVAMTRSEYLDGEIFAMAGASLRHNRIVGNCFAALRSTVDDSSGDYEVFASDLKLRVEASGLFTYPDLMVIRGAPTLYVTTDGFESDDTVTNPTLLVEVLSPSTEAYDRGEKFAHYRRIDSLQQVLLVSQQRPMAELFSRRGDLWTLETAEGIHAAVVLESIGARLELSSVYQRVSFNATPPVQR